MANTSLFKIIEYIDIYTEKNNDILIFVTLINNSLFNNSDDNDFGVRAYFSTINSIKNDDLRNLKNITFYISSKEIKFNYDLAQYYKERKIDIYNKADLAFKEPCYLSKEFDFDLTQKYRKNNIFQKVYYGS